MFRVYLNTRSCCLRIEIILLFACLLWLEPLIYYHCEVAKVGIVPNSSGKALSFTTAYVGSCGFFIYGLYHSKLPSISSLLSVFIVKRYEFCQNLLLHQWRYFGVFLHSTKVTYYIDSFCLLTHSQIPGINPTWSLEYNPFNIILWFAHILLRILMSIFIKDICNFLVVSLPGFGISVKVCKIYSRCKTKSYNP